jgi:hypothetical protein
LGHETRHLFGQARIGRYCRHLRLPQIEIALRQVVERRGRPAGSFRRLGPGFPRTGLPRFGLVWSFF